MAQHARHEELTQNIRRSEFSGVDDDTAPGSRSGAGK